MAQKQVTRRDFIDGISKKPMTRRDFLKMAGTAAGATILAAGAPEAVFASPLPSAKPAPVTLDVWWNVNIQDLYTPWISDPNDPNFWNEWYFGGLARAAFLPWLKSHPGVSLKITGHDWDVNLYFNHLNAFAAGEIPDATYGEAFVYEFAKKGYFNPVTPAVAGLFAKGTIDGARVDRKYFGVPQSSGTNVLMVNLDVLERVGLPTDHLPTTWEQLLSDAQTVSAANHTEPWGNNAYYCFPPFWSYGNAMRLLPWFNQNGAPMADQNGYPSANTARAAETWAWHTALLRTSNAEMLYQADYKAQFYEGVFAYKIGWSEDVAGCGPNVVAVPLPLPPGGKPANIVIGNQINSPCKGGKYPDLAIDLVEKVWTRKEAQEWLPQYCGIWVPALRSSLEQWRTYDKLDAYQTESAKKIVRLTMKELLQGNAGPLPNWPNNTYPAWWYWNDAYYYIWYEQRDIQPVLDELQANLEGAVTV